jgi:23S rRNA pseudouridine1911/1915/1917 synthase
LLAVELFVLVVDLVVVVVDLVVDAVAGFWVGAGVVWAQLLPSNNMPAARAWSCLDILMIFALLSENGQRYLVFPQVTGATPFHIVRPPQATRDFNHDCCILATVILHSFPITIVVPAEAAGQRLDLFLTTHLPNVSRARVQQLITEETALLNDSPAKPSLKLKGGETITVLGDPKPAPLRAIAENVPLDVVYEDEDVAVINKPAGMMVHAGAGATDDQRNRGTLVNALLHRFAQLSAVGGETRPGIVHRLDKETSGIILVACNDAAHRNLARQFSGRAVRKHYIALVHGWPHRQRGTVNLPISRDVIRRTRMTTRGSGGRTAITHYEVRQKLETPYGNFSLLDVHIETGRTHQIRVHMASLGHPVVGDTLYGAPSVLRPSAMGRKSVRQSASTHHDLPELSLKRNFLHAGAVEFTHPRTGKALSFSAPLPADLTAFIDRLHTSRQL